MALIEGGRAMLRTRRNPRLLLLLAAALVTTTLARPPAAHAANGQFEVANCQSDRVSFSTSALVPYASVGMRWRQACNTAGPGRRGYILSNKIRNGKVPYASYSAMVMDAPPGTQFQKLTWGGFSFRSD